MKKGKKKLTVGAVSVAGPMVEGLKIEQFFRFWSTGMMPGIATQSQDLRR